DKTILFFGSTRSEPPPLVSQFGERDELDVLVVHRPDDVRALLNRTFPKCVVMETGPRADEALDLCRSLKQDAFTAIVPVVVLVPTGEPDLASELLEAGADEVISDSVPPREKILRLEQVLKRADRDVSVHPTTRLPGTTHIARDMGYRLAAHEKFAVCYADLDHFKEFNDRYGYAFGDGVIRILSRILRDMVRGLAPGGFVGHIGGDDFIFIVSLEYLEDTCDGIIQLFDELIPYQYTEEDRRAGYFLGKDRRGHIHRIPLMTLSIGVVTNQFQIFEHTGQISELAAEMKTYAKTLPGSLYVVDRRQQLATLETASASAAETLANPDTPAQPT
ncbi:MAG TPA: diguanylate cyclase, partial [Longimicrobiales bacterium]|nr:diguanylate cyclase [Longimicrobiales bacterium]